MSIALKVNGQFIDLVDSSVPTMTYNGVQTQGRVRGSGSNTITIPLTPRNKKVFGDIADLDAVLETTDAFADTIQCTVFYDGNEYLHGVLVVDDWNANELKAQFLSSAANWGDALSRPLWDVDQGVGGAKEDRWQVVYNVCDWLTSPGRTGKLDPFETHTWIATAYGYLTGFIGATDSSVGMRFADQRPAAFVWPLITAHFEQAGYQLKSKFFESIANLERPDVKPLALPQVTDAVFSGEADLDPANEVLQGEVSMSVDSVSPACAIWVTGANFDTIGSDPLGLIANTNLDPCPSFPPTTSVPEYVNTKLIAIQRSGFYRVAGTIQVGANSRFAPSDIILAVPTVADFFDSRLNVVDRLVSGDLFALREYGAGESIDFDWVFEVKPEDLPAGATLYLQIVSLGTVTAKFGAGTNIGLWRYGDFSENDTYDIRETFPEVTALDLWSTLVKAFNLKVYTDEIQKVVFAEPYGEFYDLTQLNDLSPQIERSEPFDQKRISQNKKGLRIEWAKDDDDALHDSYEHPQNELAGGKLTLGSRVVLPDKGDESDTVKIESFAGTFNNYLEESDGEALGGLLVLWLRVIDEDPYLRFNWFPRIVQVDTEPTAQELYIQSTEPVDGTCSGTFTSTAVGDLYTTPFNEYVRGYFAGTLPSGTGNPSLPGGNPQYTLSAYSTDGRDTYHRYYKTEREAETELRKISGKLLLNKGRTIEEFIQYNLLWRLDNQIARIDKIDGHKIGRSNIVNANFTILKGLSLPSGEPYTPTPLTQATEYDGANDYGKFLSLDTAFLQSKGETLTWNIFYKWTGTGAPSSSNETFLVAYQSTLSGGFQPRFRIKFLSTGLQVNTQSSFTFGFIPYSSFPELIDGSKVMITIKAGQNVFINNVDTGVLAPDTGPANNWGTSPYTDVTVGAFPTGILSSPLDIAEIRIFDGALASVDRTAIYNAGSGDATWAPSNQVSHIICNQPVSPQLDSSGNGNDLTLFNHATPPIIVPF